MKICAYLNTYKRYDTVLPLAMMSLINQTRTPDKIIFFDDNKQEDVRDLRNTEHYKYIFDLMTQKGIPWEYRWGHKRGAHFNHEDANRMKGFDALYFIDDDNIAEPNCLEELEKEMKPGVGAVGGLILKPPSTPLPFYVTGKLDDIYKGENIAWHTWSGNPVECEHLYSGFLYRPGIVHHDLRLSKKVFRGETMFTHSLFLKGYKLICTPKAITWHFESATGGCRTPEEEKSNQDMYNNDSYLFNKWLEFKRAGKKLYLIREGLGDNYSFKQVITPEKDSIVATCFPDLYPGNKVISIGEAEQLVDPKDYEIYTYMEQNNWSGSLKDAYKSLYEHINSRYTPS